MNTIYQLKNHDNITRNLKDIIKNYQDIFSQTAKLDMDIGKEIVEMYKIIDLKEDFISKLNYINQLKDICEKKL